MGNLVVYCENSTLSIVSTDEEWFGKSNCKKIDSIIIHNHP
jgi:hypothetical protein